MSTDPQETMPLSEESASPSSLFSVPTLSPSGALVPETLSPPADVFGAIVRTLDHSDSSAGSTTAQAPAAAGLPTLPGYQLLRELGRGGMGVVYQARDLRLNRVVAVKMLLAGAHAGPLDRARFQLEAETVASLQHPNIIKIHEIGEQDSCPYLVLEFLEGQPLDHQLAGRPMPPPAAARVIETLARAMHCAHQRGIVHRDLKPGNVFVAPDGHLRILDFGLAKRLEGDSHTRSGTIMGTPAYMAPEQALGEIRSLGPATDIYALGAMLYEMLTGRPPFQGTSVMDTLIQVRSEDPVPPTRLNARLPRDLEVICLKCLRKDPPTRYVSAEVLADDLHRFQAGEPILARPVPAWERTIKWARRHPTAAALVAVCTTALLALLGLGIWYNARLQDANSQLQHSNAELQKAQTEVEDRSRQLVSINENLQTANTNLKTAQDRAEDRSRRARTAVDDMYTQVAEKWLDDEPYQDPLQRQFLERALQFYKEMSQEGGTDPALRQATALALFRRGQIDRALGQHADAEQAYDQAIRLQEDLVRDDPHNAPYRQELADSLNYRGELLRTTNRADEARGWYDRALELQQALVAASNRPEYRKQQARSYYNRALALAELNRLEEALVNFSQARNLLEPLTRDSKDDPSFAHELARVFLGQGAVQRSLKAFKEAEESYRTALTYQDDLTKRFPRKLDYSYELALTQNNLGNLLSLDEKRTRESQEAHEAARKLLTVLVTLHPSRPNYRRELANTWNSLGFLLSKIQPAEAEEAWKNSALEFERLATEWPDVPDYHHGAGLAYGNLGWLIWTRKHQADLALPHLRAAAEHLERVHKTTDLQYRRRIGGVYMNLAEVLVQLCDHAGAAEAVEKFLEHSAYPNRDQYRAAQLLARALVCSEKDANSTVLVRRLRSECYACRCLQLLRLVDFRKFTPKPPPSAEPAFQALVGRTDFQRFLADWEKAAQKP